MYGVSIPNNTIVAAGSVVTHSFVDENIVIGGNPAGILCEWSDLQKRKSSYFVNVNGMNAEQKKDYLLNKANLVSR